LCAFVRERAREPIFCKTHTNEFCGIGKSTQEPAGSCGPLRPGRWVYEKEGKSLCGADCRVHSRHRSTAAFTGRLVPFHTSPPSRGALRSAGVPTIAASTTSAPMQPWRLTARGLRGIREDSAGAREYPMCAEGWALWVIGGSPDFSVATGGTYRLGKPSGAEPPGRASSWGV
jgi:hypothetical protein